MLVPVPIPSGSIEPTLAKMEGDWRARLARLEAGERRLRSLAAVSRKLAARAAKLEIEKERQRLGRELHTGVGQLLAAVRIQVELIDQFLPERSEPVAKALEQIGALTSDAMEQMRAVSRELYVPEWQRVPLPQAIERLWDRSGIPQRYRASLELAALPVDPPAKIKALLCRAAQEGISNVIRHARASEVRLALELADERLVLTVTDNGVGLPAPGREPAPQGIGIRALRDEAEAVGATVSLERGAAGTTLRVSAPIPC